MTCILSLWINGIGISDLVKGDCTFDINCTARRRQYFFLKPLYLTEVIIIWNKMGHVTESGSFWHILPAKISLHIYAVCSESMLFSCQLERAGYPKNMLLRHHEYGTRSETIMIAWVQRDVFSQLGPRKKKTISIYGTAVFCRPITAVPECRGQNPKSFCKSSCLHTLQ